jgi:tetratricopeptide (TPR) repeat protein
LYVHVCKVETLRQAYALAKNNDGAPGVDGVTFAAIEPQGVATFLEQLQDELVRRTYVPLPARRQEIPKDGGKVRVLSIPAIRDRVVQGALKLILEPIFEADFQPGSFGYRPKCLLPPPHPLRQPAEAEELRGLSINEKALGPDHPDVGTSLINLAALYRQQGRYGDTELLIKRSLSIREKALGPDHADVAQSLNNLALLYESQGRYADAEPLYKRAEAIPGWEVADIPILFATNRGRAAADRHATFSEKQKEDLKDISFGRAIARAPKSEVLNRAERAADALGQLHRASGRQTEELSLRVLRVDVANAGADLAPFARNRLGRAARFLGQAFVYVHGYNNSFDEAVRRTAMIAFDLDSTAPRSYSHGRHNPGCLAMAAIALVRASPRRF